MQYEEIAKLAKAITEVAEGITELTRRIDKLVSRGHTGYAHRLALVRRIKELEKKQCNLWAETVSMVNDLAQRVNALAKVDEFLAECLLSQKRRIEQLEKLLKKDGTND